MRKQSSSQKQSSPPTGGRRNHSRFAPFYEEVCRLRAKRFTWQEIADHLSLREGVPINRTALWKMWDNRQRGAVRTEYVPVPIAANPSQNQVSSISDEPEALLSSSSPEAEEDEILGITPAASPGIVLKVRGGKSKASATER